MQRPNAKAERSRLIQASPEVIFAILAEPDNLASILPRVQRVEVLQRVGDTARVRTHMAIGPIGSFTAEGDVRWQAGRELLFRATQPVLVESRWTLVPEAHATRVTVTMLLDLTPMLGPFAAFIPPASISALVVPDLDAALAAIAKRVE
jgi:carbon monoxide dehydrogenase subunit G